MCFDLTILGWKHKEKIDTEIKKYEFRFNHIGMETLFFSALFWVDLQSFDLTILGWKRSLHNQFSLASFRFYLTILGWKPQI